MAQLKNKTIQMGGNAIVGVDVDYGELGSIKGMIMVCMTGT
ncbi:MAG: heavy metal-binding domain-containing protein, partial [Bacteroidetes bacterium]|nr:heavy metal-binding domain-containing protein [Bacteroidota bacterium]